MGRAWLPRGVSLGIHAGQVRIALVSPVWWVNGIPFEAKPPTLPQSTHTHGLGALGLHDSIMQTTPRDSRGLSPGFDEKEARIPVAHSPQEQVLQPQGL